MPDQAGDVIGAALAAIGAEHHPGLARLEQLSRPEHELKVSCASSTRPISVTAKRNATLWGEGSGTSRSAKKVL